MIGSGNDSYMAKKNRAQTRMTFRVIASLYLLYLTYGIIKGVSSGKSEAPLWLAVTASVIFLTVAVLFSYYAWKEYKKAVAKAKEEEEALAVNKSDSVEDSQTEIKADAAKEPKRGFKSLFSGNSKQTDTGTGSIRSNANIVSDSENKEE